MIILDTLREFICLYNTELTSCILPKELRKHLVCDPMQEYGIKEKQRIS